MSQRDERAVFLLTREAKQRGRGFTLVYWGWSDRGPVRIRLTDRRAIFFVERTIETRAGERSPTSLVTMDGRPVDRVEFATRDDHRREADRLRMAGTPAWEDDVKPHDRALMDKLVTSACTVRGPMREHRGYVDFEDPEMAPADVVPSLRVASFDVEAEGPDAPIYAVSIVCGDEERAFVRGPGHFADERSTIAAFLDYVAELDPDVLIGWNVIEFDLAYLESRCHVLGLPFVLGRAGERSSVLRGSSANAPSVARVSGRVILDGIATMRAATWSFENYSLENVAQELLGRGKKIAHTDDKLAEIQRMYAEDLPALVAYNLEDCRLARDVFAKAHLLEFAIERQRLTGLTMDRRAGAVSAFDHLYLPRLHQRGRVAPSPGASEMIPSPGGFVMGSEPGLYENVLVLDFKSLYPSIIRTFLVDPLGLSAAGDDAVEGFSGARFSRTEHILPGVIETLWAARDEAKKNEDAALQRAIKILMNSFYGVLGTPACRFFDPRLASSITLRGHAILQQSRAWLEREHGLRVIYGDTDSLFVLIGAGPTHHECLERGRALARELNAYWRERIEREHRLRSALELQLDACFVRFLMPTVRGGEMGSKKRYAGIAAGNDGRTKLIIKGLEAVRTDWTPLARSFQRELLRRVFEDVPYKDWIRALTDDLFRGKLDAELVYTKRLRRDMDEYAGKGVPPHVAAARLSGRALREVAYVMTTRGPEPITHRRSPIDYQHYLEKQLAPAADTVLPFLGDRFMNIGGRQLSLF